MKSLFALMLVCAALVVAGCAEDTTTTTTPPATEPGTEEPADGAAPAGEEAAQ